MIRGASYTIDLIFNAEYDVTRVKDLRLTIGNYDVCSLADGISNSGQHFLCSIPSDITAVLPVGERSVTLTMEDATDGVRKAIIATIPIQNTGSQYENENVSETANMTLELTYMVNNISADLLITDVTALRAIAAANAAKDSEDAAKISEDNAKQSETNASQSESDTLALKNTVQGLHDTVVIDAAQVALDRIATGEDAAQTALDRIATGQDAQTATEKAGEASDSAAAALQSKNYASGYADDAEAAKLAAQLAETNAETAEANAEAAEAQTLLYKDAAAAIVSGGPRGVYATASDLITANPDHLYTYVVTADGHWYYWNGSTFADGGAYQTVQDYALERKPFAGVTSYQSLAAHIIGSHVMGAISLITPFSTGGFGTLHFSIFDLNLNATTTRQQKIDVSFFFGGLGFDSIDANGYGDPIITEITTIFDGSNWRIFFNKLSDSIYYRHIVLESAEFSFSMDSKDYTNGFSFATISNITGWSAIDKNILLTNAMNKNEADAIYLPQKKEFSKISTYSLPASYILSNGATGAIYLKSPLTSTSGGFCKLKFSIYNLGSEGVELSQQKLDVSFYISGGIFVSLIANSTGSKIITRLFTSKQGEDWYFLFNKYDEFTPYRHIVLESAEFSFGLETPDFTNQFVMGFTSDTGWGNTYINVVNEINENNIVSTIGNNAFGVIGQIGFSDIMTDIFGIIAKQAKVNNSPKTGNVIVVGDSTIDNVYGFDGVADYLSIQGNMTDISTGGDDIAAQVIKWNAIDTPAKLAANYVFIQIGINNITNTTDIPALLSQLQSFIDLIKTESPTAFIVLGTITPYYARFVEIYGTEQANIAQQKWVDFNAGIKGEGATPIINVNAVASEHTTILSDTDGSLLAIYNSGDQLHENNIGRLVIAQSWRSKI